MQYFTLLTVLIIISGCSSKNIVERITQENSVTKYQKASAKPKRFTNLYSQKPAYPKTCSQNCYPPASSLKCEHFAENCQFTAEQPKLPLNTGFAVQWLGHASFLISTPDGTKLLFDPVSGQFDWPVNWAFWLSEGFNRKTPQWPSKSELAAIDAVFYSHNTSDSFMRL
ncbi:MAG: MBL fold metallo-hydrolase [Gammaproteobacteria bacterium]|nr:MBL fold metallo-hydrolase [Gammaproteobacteria bacterium]